MLFLSNPHFKKHCFKGKLSIPTAPSTKAVPLHAMKALGVEEV
jgi:hypothetical protein